jgi:hypothetical protein
MMTATADFLNWVKVARPGDTFIYATATGGLHRKLRASTHQTAVAARTAFLNGEVDLVQRRLGEKPADVERPGRFEYLAIKRREVTPPKYPWDGCEFPRVPSQVTEKLGKAIQREVKRFRVERSVA